MIQIDRPPSPIADRDRAADLPEGDVGRWAVIGSAIGFTVMTVAITIVGSVGGLGFGPSVGLGLFLGFWGGAGFGLMMGLTIPLARHADAAPVTQASYRRTTPSPSR